MSFSSEIKEELSKINNLNNKQLVKAELNGYLVSNNISINSNKLKYATESEYNINRFAKLLNNVNILDYTINIQRKLFVITCNLNHIKNIFNIKNNEIYIIENYNNTEEIKALIRGAFLGSGSMNNPEKVYHLEMDFSNNYNAEYIQDELKKVNIKFKILKGKNDYCLYIKDGEEISKFLAFIGANNAVLKFEDIRVKHDMSNKVNRLVNCKTANLNKTINAAITQIEAIRYLQKTKEFEKLDNSLKEIAIVRIENPDLPLSELGNLLKEPIGKSGVNYRLKKIVNIANEILEDSDLLYRKK